MSLAIYTLTCTKYEPSQMRRFLLIFRKSYFWSIFLAAVYQSTYSDAIQRSHCKSIEIAVFEMLYRVLEQAPVRDLFKLVIKMSVGIVDMPFLYPGMSLNILKEAGRVFRRDS